LLLCGFGSWAKKNSTESKLVLTYGISLNATQSTRKWNWTCVKYVASYGSLMSTTTKPLIFLWFSVFFSWHVRDRSFFNRGWGLVVFRILFIKQIPWRLSSPFTYLLADPHLYIHVWHILYRCHLHLTIFFGFSFNLFLSISILQLTVLFVIVFYNTAW